MSRHDAAALAREYGAAYYAAPDDPRIAAWAAAHASVWDALAARALRLQPDAKALLDIGAGSGGFLRRVRAQRPTLALAAVETSEPARVALAVSLPDVTFPPGGIAGLADLGPTFDLVTILQTLEHVDDPVAACRAAHACLRVGGTLLVTVPNRRSLHVLRHGDAADCFANGTHLQFFAGHTLVRTLHTAGFGRVRRLVEFGGGQHDRVLPRLAQFALRALGLSRELRYAATRTE